MFFVESLPQAENEWNKRKNHFSEVKVDVGMSPHEKEGKQEDVHTKTESHSNPPLHLCFFKKNLAKTVESERLCSWWIVWTILNNSEANDISK